MRATRRHGESRGHEHGVELTERSIELREAHIVANGQRKPSEGALHCDRSRPRLERARLVVALLAATVEAEKMHLVVTDDTRAGVVEKKARAEDAARIARFERRSSTQQPYAVPAGRIGQKILDRARAFALAPPHLVRLVAA